MPIFLTLLRQFWPYIAAFLVGASMGGGGAWKVQGYRLTEAKQEFTDFKQEQTRIFNDNKAKADKQREQSGKEYAHLSEILSDEINQGVVFKRCVAAGKCGVRQQSTCAAGVRLPASGSTDESRTDSVPIAGESTAEDPVIGECATTTLMLNRLQSDIAKQAGY